MSLPCKTYVDVLARFDESGGVTPLRVRWEDGRVFPVDRVLDVRRVASLKGGRLGIRYIVRIAGKDTYPWRDNDFWFVEQKKGRYISYYNLILMSTTYTSVIFTLRLKILCKYDKNLKNGSVGYNGEYKDRIR